MIISASRRTDIPAFYAPWLINRVRAGYCTVPNPYNREQVSRVSLKLEDVDVVVFWTRSPRPLFPYLQELDERGYPYYFQFTLMNNPRQIDPGSPPVEAAISAFIELAQYIGPERVIWRYDPLVFSSITGAEFHLEQYKRIAGELRGYTFHSVISIMDEYPKIKKRLHQMASAGAGIPDPDPTKDTRFRDCIQGLVSIAAENGMEITSCAEEPAFSSLGVRPGKCIDEAYIQRVFGIQVGRTKDPNQRKLCGCATSRDIGMYDSCLFGCQYCYATTSFETARRNYASHQLDSPSLIGWYEEK